MSGHGAGAPGLPAQAGRAQSEQLQAVIIHPVAGAAGHVADDRPEAGVVDLVRSPAPGADDVMVMGRLAADVGVLARGEVKALDGAQVLEDLERPIDRRSTDRPTLAARRLDEAGRREMAVLVGDEPGQRPARRGQSVARAVELSTARRTDMVRSVDDSVPVADLPDSRVTRRDKPRANPILASGVLGLRNDQAITDKNNIAPRFGFT